jgi:hypothetical protein
MIPHRLLQYYAEKYPDINFKFEPYLDETKVPRSPGLIPINAEDKHKVKFIYDGATYQSFFIENPDNNKYILVSNWDRSISWVSHFPDFDYCVQFFTNAGTQSDDTTYNEINTIDYLPIVRAPYMIETYTAIENCYRSNSERPVLKKPYYRSCSYGLRRWVWIYDNRFDVYCERLSETKFVEEMNQSAINIDLNCVAGVSDRTAVAMGLGTVLVRPPIKMKMYSPMIPDYHYAEVKCDWTHDYPKLMDAYIDRYEEVKKDRDFMMFISENARKYYLENCTVEAHLNIFKNTINLDLLR